MTELWMQRAREAARARREATRAPADRPSQRRNAEAGRSSRVVAPSVLSLRAVADSSALTFDGMASVTNRAYEMFDVFGPYDEEVRAGSFMDTLAQDGLDVPLVLGHDQMRRMARTGNAVSPLLLDEVTDGPETGLRVQAPSLPADNPHVMEIAPLLRDGLIDEMSFAFRITAGRWSDDFTRYTITAVDLHRGDVAIVGYGANPFTSASLRTPSISQAERLRAARLAIARASV